MPQTPPLHPNIAAYIPMVEGVVKLLHPFAEGAIHDLRQGKVVALFNNISKRSIGDPSVVAGLGIEVKDFPDVFDPYYKTNWDGRNLKCVSITVRDDAGAPIGLVCINFDTSVFEAISSQLGLFLTLKNQAGLNPVEQFATDWRGQVMDYISAYTQKHNIAPQTMTKAEKADLVKQIYAHGLFNYRDAAAYVAKVLGVSRATVYNYLKEDKE